MKIHCCQLDIVWEDKAANHARVRAMLERARPEKGSLVLLPEMFATGFTMNVSAASDEPARQSHEFLSGLARQQGVYILAGLIGLEADGRGRNEAVLFSPEGREAARYQKMQPFAPGGEAKHYSAGQAPITFAWSGFTVAPFICYDLRFPELFRRAAAMGANLYAVIASWPVARINHWVTLLQARAIENQAYVAGVNRIGSDPKLTYTGRSLIVDPRGQILADAGDAEQMISADLDLPALQAYRHEHPFLPDMKKEHFLGW